MLVVFGSINMDVNVMVRIFPQEGETVLSHSYTMSPGGKGANQALAAGRMETKTALVGKVGDDGNGLRVINNLKRNGVMTSGIAKSDDLPTGLAMVMKNKEGDNRIIVACGANVMASADQVPPDILHKDNLLLLQMELPLEQAAIVMKQARDHGARVVLNMAPVLKIPKQLLLLVDDLIVNELEARQLAAILGLPETKDLQKIAQSLAKEGQLNALITCGAQGVMAVQKNGKYLHVPTLAGLNIFDTTGAGDCFCGTFAACLHDGLDFEEAVKMGVAAASLSCEKAGTQDSFPYLEEIKEARKRLA